MSYPPLAGVLCVFGGFLYHLALGYFYTVGNMNPYIISYMGIRASESAWFASVILALQAVNLPFGGFMAKKIGFRWVLIIGMLFGSAGILLTRLTINYGLGPYIFTYCILFGVGMGFPYSVIFHVASSWFPAYRATVVGIIAAGFGLGAFVFSPIQTAIINPENQKANGTKFPAEIEERIPNAFLILGGIFTTFEVLGTLMMRECPTTESPKANPFAGEHVSENDSLKEDACKEPVKMQRSYTIHEAVKSIDFYILAIIVFCDVIPIVIFTSTFKVFGISQGYDDKFLSIVATVSSGFNCGGRVIWGFIVDRFSSKCPLMILLLQWGVLFISFPFLTVFGGQYLYAFFVFAIFFHLSGHFVIIPGACTRIFGPANMATIYGLVFAATAPSALITAAIISQFIIANNWVPVYITCGIACFTGFIVSLFLLDKNMHCVDFTSICSQVCNPCRVDLDVHDDEEERAEQLSLKDGVGHTGITYQTVGDN